MCISSILIFPNFFISAGKRASCSNEGEEVALDSIKDMKCYKCICQVSEMHLIQI